MELLAAPNLSSTRPPHQALRKTLRFKNFRLFAALNQNSTRQSDHFGDPLLRNFLKLQVPLSIISVTCFPLSSIASENEQIFDKISVESVLVSVDNFFIRYPFVGPAVSFIWLVILPLASDYFKKFKYISAIGAFVKLRDDPSYQLLDIRKEYGRDLLESPDLTSLKKSVVRVEFSEGKEAAFVAEIVKSLKDPSETSVCVIDNFDDDSLKVAELLVKNGFKEAYAIKGGLRGKDGWQTIQETLLPPDVRVYPRKKNPSVELDINGQKSDEPAETSKISARNDSPSRSSSPYPNYPDLKPPSSPTPSKP